MDSKLALEAAERLEGAAQAVAAGWARDWYDFDIFGKQRVCAAAGIMSAQKPDMFQAQKVTSTPIPRSHNDRTDVPKETKCWIFHPDAATIVAMLALANAVSGKVVLAADVRTRFIASTTIVAEWNDAPERKQAEVVAMLQAAAATLRAQATLKDPCQEPEMEIA